MTPRLPEHRRQAILPPTVILSLVILVPQLRPITMTTQFAYISPGSKIIAYYHIADYSVAIFTISLGSGMNTAITAPL